MKPVSILGSTGSIGRNTLAVIGKFPGRFRVCALTAKSNIQLLAEQIRLFKPDLAAVYDRPAARALTGLLPSGTKTEVVYGESGYAEAATHREAETVVSAMVGAAGLKPTLAAIDSGKDIALANKETLVMAGPIVMERAEARGVRILPVDSEHSAIFQCLRGNRRSDLQKVLLTASGGPFVDLPAAAMADIRPEDALKHPNWAMGRKITIDSATLMNKGLEVIEALHLFSLDLEQIEVVVHPQSIIHSMVAYRDGSVLAQLGVPDMKGAIAYALSFPERMPLDQPLPDFYELGALTFHAPDMEKFPCLDIAFRACRAGGTMPAVLNAANETAVHAFLSRRISFVQIPAVIQETMARHELKPLDIEEVLRSDQWARDTARDIIARGDAGS